ncbi:MarR family transcriptional regulator [Streptomyces sp. AJS327]|uniref:MarR family transcriptional regulator n=1 Tax=Streptomyces sp. AJS327 TaxID=2545265 RepID=UPI0015DE4A55|nr:MarR family transcriptional regulator [Streptomyces sp. AJS327]MBA0050049.1 MarR family transcriptional regulator [Streptomyces sp. AJS327]
MRLTEYPTERIAAQPVGGWTGQAYRAVVGAIRVELAREDLTQPAWWVLGQVSGAPGGWDRERLTALLRPYNDLGLELEAVYDELIARGLLAEEEGTFTLTPAGEETRQRAWARLRPLLATATEGVTTEEYVTTINVLRRIVANLGGDGDLP